MERDKEREREREREIERETERKTFLSIINLIEMFLPPAIAYIHFGCCE